MYVLNFKGVLKKADLANYELIRRRAYYHRCEICKPGLLAIATVHNHCASDIQLLYVYLMYLYTYRSCVSQALS